MDDAKEFLSKDKSTSQHAVKDYESVMKSLSHEKTEKTPKMKKPLVELFQKELLVPLMRWLHLILRMHKMMEWIK